MVPTLYNESCSPGAFAQVRGATIQSFSQFCPAATHGTAVNHPHVAQKAFSSFFNGSLFYRLSQNKQP